MRTWWVGGGGGGSGDELLWPQVVRYSEHAYIHNFYIPASFVLPRASNINLLCVLTFVHHTIYTNQLLHGLVKGRGQFRPKTGHERPKGKYRHSFFFKVGGRCGWVVNATPRPGRFMHGEETPYPVFRRLRWPQGRSGQMRKPPPGRYSTPGPTSP
jgi:hypothetical protein